MINTDLTVTELTEENIESMVYEIRGQKVMLDFDLARIYGYSTKRFNEQVKRNIEKFPEDFMFSLTNTEVEAILKYQKATATDNLRSQNATANELSSKRRYNPYVFTEQGIYMLMTVLRGELAVKQSKALIRLFKRMKDYINNDILLINNASLINNKFLSYDKRLDIVESKLDIVMNNFIDPSKYKHFLLLDGQRVEGDVAYQTIYSLAEHSIIIIDDYIDIKTLQLLKVAKKEIDIVICSDNKAKNTLTEEYVNDFIKDTGMNLIMIKNNRRFHDRYIVIDYKKDKECIYHCGTSSKDVGNRVTTITEIEDRELYYPLIDKILMNTKVY